MREKTIWCNLYFICRGTIIHKYDDDNDNDNDIDNEEEEEEEEEEDCEDNNADANNK